MDATHTCTRTHRHTNTNTCSCLDTRVTLVDSCACVEAAAGSDSAVSRVGVGERRLGLCYRNRGDTRRQAGEQQQQPTTTSMSHLFATLFWGLADGAADCWRAAPNGGRRVQVIGRALSPIAAVCCKSSSGYVGWCVAADANETSWPTIWRRRRHLDPASRPSAARRNHSGNLSLHLAPCRGSAPAASPTTDAPPTTDNS